MPGQIPRGTSQQQLFAFRGLVNKKDPTRARRGANFSHPLQTALNIDLDDFGKVTKATGFTQIDSGAYYAAYSMRSEERCFVVKDGGLHLFYSDGSTDLLLAGVNNERMHFVEVGPQVFATNGSQYYALSATEARVWGLSRPLPPQVETMPGSLPAGQYQVVQTANSSGRESGASYPAVVTLDGTQGLSISSLAATPRVYVTSTNGDVFYEIAVSGTQITWNGPVENLRDPLRMGHWSGPPAGSSLPAFYEGRIYLAQAIPSVDVTAVWFSQPLGYEHFDVARDFFQVPGTVRMLAGTRTGLIVGTNYRIYSYTEEGGLSDETSQLDYGVVDGATAYPAPELGGEISAPATVYFWTEQGVCSGLPFRNLTQEDVSLPPGRDGAGIVVEQGGVSRYTVVVKRDGQARNPF